MNLHQLEVFEAIMRSGSVSEAARTLDVSQPAVSKTLRLAEEAAGFVLFRRVRGRLYPSPEAETLLPQVEQVRHDLNAISLLIRQLRDGHAGQVTVASAASLAHAFVTPAVAQFTRENPSIRIELQVLPTHQVADRVAQSQADFGLVHEPTENPYIAGENICQADAVCFMAKDHPLAHRKSVGPRDLQDSPLLCYREDTALGRLVRKALADAGQRREIDIVINQSEQALDLAEAGAGVSITEPFLYIARPRSAIVGVPFRPAIPMHLRIIRARERPRSRAAAQLERAIRSVIARSTRRSPFPVREIQP